MLTPDENIVDLDFDVVWQVNPARAQDFVFNLQNPQGTIKSVAESAMREVIGRRNIQAILLSGLLYELSLFFAAPSADARYSEWLVATTLIAVVLLVARRARAAPQ